MTVREDTIKELTATDITKWVEHPMHASVKKMRKELAEDTTAIKTRYDTFPMGLRFGYAAAIMLTEDYKARVPNLAVDWEFEPPM